LATVRHAHDPVSEAAGCRWHGTSRQRSCRPAERRGGHEARSLPPRQCRHLSSGEPGATTLRHLPDSRSREQHGSSSAATTTPHSG